MEIIEPKNKRSAADPRNIYIGLLLIGLGTAWLAHNAGWMGERAFDIIFSWQMLVIEVGGFLLVVRRWLLGALVTGLGMLLLLTGFFGWHIPVWQNIGPVAVIVLGIAFLVQKKR
ncbi:MAG: hypothetical protein IJC16_09375 [Rikenellaceae bacterium]|nr:hypothetical protein [Rikenellaceae bacterium]